MATLYNIDNIIAEITPFGRAAVSGIRLSGPDVFDIIKVIFNLKKIEPRKAIFVKHEIDEIILLCFKTPFSYTGEDVSEIFCHGNPLIVDFFIKEILSCTAFKTRLAGKGEFTKRAYLNGKLDLLQAESVVDLINSHSINELKFRNNVLSGDLSDQLLAVKNYLMEIAVKSELEIDFDDEDLISFSYSEAIRSIDLASKIVEDIQSTFSNVEKFAVGIKVVVTGNVNVGKSTLFNKLIGKDRALVDPEAGTTRDYIEHVLFVDGLELTFVDTAGMRETATSNVEKMGIDRVSELINNSMLVVEVTDNDNYNFRFNDSIHVRNKADLLPIKINKNCKLIYTSAITGTGIHELRTHIISTIKANLKNNNERESGYLVSKHQKEKILSLLNNLNSLKEELIKQAPVDVISMFVLNCIKIINDIFGMDKAQDEVLNNLFERFCIGK